MAGKKKRTSGRGGRSTRAASRQAGFVAEGLKTVLGWLGTLVLAAGALAAWCSRRLWQVLHGERARRPLGMVLAAVSVFVFVALVDFEAGLPERNVCGSLGHRLADLLLYTAGVGAYLLAGFGVFWGIARMVREGPSSAAVKLVGVIVLALTAAVIAGGLVPEPRATASLPGGPGGWIGHHFYPPLHAALGGFGSAVLLGLLAVISSLLATEWAFVPLVKELLRKTAAAGGLHQPELPLEAPRKGARELLEEAEENKAKAALGLRRLWQGVVGLFRPFDPEAGAEKPAPAAAARAGSIPMRSSVPLLDEPATRPEPEPMAGPASPARPEPEPEPEPVGAAAAGGEGFSLPGISAGPDLTSGPQPAEAPAPRRRRRQPTLGSLPPMSILSSGQKRDRAEMQAEIDELGRRLQNTFDSFGLDAAVVGAERGPTLTLFEVKLAEGVSVKKLKNQRDDLAVALGAHGVRIVYPLPGRTTVGIEVPNLKRENVFLKDVLEEASTAGLRLPMVIGRDTLGKAVVEDLTRMPHMLVAGTTGSGKSVCLNSILMTMLLTRGPSELRLVLIDPKQVEMQLYQDIPHLACPVVTDMKRAPFVLEWALRQMEDRLHQFKMAGVRNIADYNDLGKAELKRRLGEEVYDPEEFPGKLPYIVLVIDELADMMMVSAKEVEIAISRLAAKARAAGIHLLVATQRPSTDVVTGLIKMNLPVRIAFKVTSSVDSRVILDDSGADLLLGNGDFLYRPPGAAGMTRGQGAFVSEKEVREACDHLRAHGKPEFIEDLVQMKGAPGGDGQVDDPLYEDAVRIILQSGRGSASLLQRALSIGYTRASRLIDIMSEQGVLGPFIGSKAREVLLTLEEWEAQRESR
ncbi:MAG: DNA translocase FtsK [Planctomycetota bacterium]|nr:MAG: DNA translocase FtsK [Planctomycetota bacterium]